MRLPAGPPLQLPVQPDAPQGRSWARAELARPGYEQPGLVRRALEWLLERLQALPLPHGTGSALTGTLLVLVVALLVVWAVRRAGGPLGRRTPVAGEVFDDGTRAAAWHRAEADRAAAAGDLRTAVLERFRAIVRDLEERAVLADRPGRTAGEAAAAAGARLPALAGDLGAAARVFDEVRYGDRPATPDADAALRALDARLQAERPVTAGTPGLAP